MSADQTKKGDQPYGIDGLAVTIDTGNDAWAFQGKTAQPWEVPFIPELSVSASLRMGASPVALPDRVDAAQTNPEATEDWFATVAPQPVDPDKAPGRLRFDLTIINVTDVQL